MSTDLDVVVGMSTKDEHYPQEYIDGSVEFFYRRFVLNEHVLIPRYETETLVRKGIEICKQDNVDTIIDIGTWSGIIPISIACNVDVSQVVATDISREALEVAQENARILYHEGVQFFEGDLLSPIVENVELFDGRSVLITANLPYVWLWEKDHMSPDTNYEPDVALFGDGREGFDIYGRFFKQLDECVKKRDPEKLQVIIEFGMWQRDIADEVLRPYDWDYSFFQDERGIERFAHIVM